MWTRRALVIGNAAAAAALLEDLSRVPGLLVGVASVMPGPDDAPDIVASAAAPELAAEVLRRAIEIKVPVADMHAPLQDALALDGLAREKQQPVCVRCAEVARLLGAAPDDGRAAAFVTAALARRLLTGDFRPHWGIWTPERLLARAGLAHGLREDLRERGIPLSRAAPATRTTRW